uniref:Uncharacterized protein n=1 Tax=Anguilla anguilla TaxID=7936 RepID=A0A0E9RHE0_ANGAN
MSWAMSESLHLATVEYTSCIKVVYKLHTQ